MKKIALILVVAFFTSFSVKKVEDVPKLNKQNLIEVIKEMDIDHPDIVYAQAILESAELTSKICKENNNLFGMKVPKKRETTAIDVRRGYASYENWLESVRDYKLYQDYVTKNKDLSRSEYLRIIARRYSETADYVSRLNRVIRENKQYINQI